MAWQTKGFGRNIWGKGCVMIMFASSHNGQADYVSVWLCFAGCCHQEMSLSPWTWGEYLDVIFPPEHVKHEHVKHFGRLFVLFVFVCGISEPTFKYTHRLLPVSGHFFEALACMMEITSKARACPFSPWKPCFKRCPAHSCRLRSQTHNALAKLFDGHFPILGIKKDFKATGKLAEKLLQSVVQVG